MQLQEIVDKDLSVPLVNLAGDMKIIKEIQTRLSELGCLEPPADGKFGPVSQFTLLKFCEKIGIKSAEAVDKRLAQALLESSKEILFPVNLGNDLASRIVKYMEQKDYWLARMPDFQNIIYIEGADADGTPNKDELNVFNDRRIILVIKNDKPQIIFNAEATTEPSRSKTLTPENPKGAARIQFGAYKAWRIGRHPQSRPSRLAHEALVQVEIIPVHRDTNKDGSRIGDTIDASMMFGINQHSAHDAPKSNIGAHGAGCLVGRLHAEHKEFIGLCKKDPRFRIASRGYTFRSTIIAGDDLKAKTA